MIQAIIILSTLLIISVGFNIMFIAYTRYMKKLKKEATINEIHKN